MQLPLYKIFLCSIINPLSDLKCQYFKDGALVVKRKASAYQIVDIGHAKEILPQYSKKRSIELIKMKDKLMLPPFFDMHFHWVQDDVCLMPKEDLLDWLANFTWPNEAKFKDKTFARKKVNDFTKKLLSVGTLGGGCFASLHGHTVDLALNKFVGDFVVGNVLMTMNSPDYLIQSDDNALKVVEKKSKEFGKRYALTPRFAITTAPDVMKKGAMISKRYDSFIQSHLAETPAEIEYVLDIYRKIPGFEKVASYTEIYDRCKILGPKTIMGHGIYLGPSELKTLRETKTAIAHCPTSNAPVEELGLGSGLFDFKKIEKAGIRWALGSDIGGGPFLSMLDVMRSFVEQNRKCRAATYIKSLYRASLAGAEILGVSSRVGNLSPGKEGNFLLLDAPGSSSNDPGEIIRAIIESESRAIYGRIVKKVYFRGHRIYHFK